MKFQCFSVPHTQPHTAENKVDRFSQKRVKRSKDLHVAFIASCDATVTRVEHIEIFVLFGVMIGFLVTDLDLLMDLGQIFGNGYTKQFCWWALTANNLS